LKNKRGKERLAAAKKERKERKERPSLLPLASLSASVCLPTRHFVLLLWAGCRLFRQFNNLLSLFLFSFDLLGFNPNISRFALLRAGNW
jgi:hypothetical protein